MQELRARPGARPGGPHQWAGESAGQAQAAALRDEEEAMGRWWSACTVWLVCGCSVTTARRRRSTGAAGTRPTAARSASRPTGRGNTSATASGPSAGATGSEQSATKSNHVTLSYTHYFLFTFVLSAQNTKHSLLNLKIILLNKEILSFNNLYNMFFGWQVCHNIYNLIL